MFRKKEVSEEQHTLWFIDEVLKRIQHCKTKKEKEMVRNIVLDRLGHKHKVTGAFAVMDKMSSMKEDNLDVTKKVRKMLELE
ncbi:hypothetical protein CMI37_29350 [Candidatus Pacearchaeota archaeon]|nr:hypothetical protein [Candidatus Pacearchaeota archaeon]|tara:strand:+ start:2506 stop:2751 length:246 start_codon:yes stop_codon:yes gene_type:complete